MEAAFVNTVEPGDKVLVLENGVFGNRMADVAERLGAQVTKEEFTWGTPVRVERVKELLEQDSYKIVAVVHAETSTGVRNPVAEIGELVRSALPGGYGDQSGRNPGRSGQLACGRLLQRNPEVPELPAWPGASVYVGQGDGEGP